MARLNKAPITIEAVARIDALFAIERDVNGLLPDERRQIRRERSRPRVEALGIWLREQHARLSPNNQVAKAIAYSLNAWDALVRFLDDGHLCITNNAAERSLRCIAVGRNNWTFAGSDAGGRRAAAIYTLIETAKLDDVDPQAWLTDVLARLQDHPPGQARRRAAALELEPAAPQQTRRLNLQSRINSTDSSAVLAGCVQQWRRIATRYDKLAANFLGFVKLASIMLWLK